MSAVAGLDLGGTKILAALVADDGTITERRTVPTPTTNAEDILGAMQAIIDDWMADGRAEAVGVAAAGFLDAERTTFMHATNLPWNEEPLIAPLIERWGRPVVLENDATAAAWGEWRFGSGRGVDDFVLVTIGTGIGGGIVTGGRLVRGSASAAAEIGHIRFVRDGLACGCGQRGCWEQYASGNALTGALDAAGLTRDDINERPEADAIVADVTTAIGEGIGTLVTILDPEVVALGGGVIAGNPHMVRLTEKAARRFSPASDHRRPLTVVGAALGNDAGLVGAADIARNEL